MKVIKKYEEFIKEYSDYRNVTGYGTMGIGGEQNAGPSFNKGPDSATYRRPDVIGVTSDVISDPYFAGERTQRMKRAKKNPKTLKNRIKKAKYFDDIDTKGQRRLLEQHDMDPYGEENWARDEREIQGHDYYERDDYYDMMDSMPTECIICGHWFPRFEMEEQICPECYNGEKNL